LPFSPTTKGQGMCPGTPSFDEGAARREPSDGHGHPGTEGRAARRPPRRPRVDAVDQVVERGHRRAGRRVALRCAL